MAELIILDPTEVATSRTQLDITPWVGEEGVDWGDADIVAYMADEPRGSIPTDYRVPNRTITIPLVLKAVGGTAFATARTNFQAKAALLQREGGWLKRLTSTGGTVFADIVDATLKLGGGWMQAHRNADTDAQLVLQARPDFYGAEVTLPDHASAGQQELVFTETGIQGDYPGRVRMVVDEDEAQSKLGLVWGWRSQNYSSAATARLAYNAGTLTPQGGGTVHSTTMRDASVPAVWSPVVMTDIVPSGALTHVGTYRVWAKVSYSGFTDLGVDVRLVWGVGGLSVPVENAAVRVPGSDHAYTVDLGEVRLDASPVGTHRWRGQIQAKAATPPAAVTVTKVWIVPVDEGYGVLRAPVTVPTSFTAFRVRDEFNQSAGALGGKTVQVGGGTFVAFQNGAAPTDFQTNGGGILYRTATAESWRGAVAGTSSLTDVSVQYDFSWTDVDPAEDGTTQIFARRIDQNNFIAMEYETSPDSRLILQRWTSFTGGGGSYTVLGTKSVPLISASTWYTLRLYVDTAGNVAGWLVPRDSVFGDPMVAARTSDAATGGALATGTVGLIELYTSAVARLRVFDNLRVYTPTRDAVLHASQSAELRWDGLYREDITGVGYGPVPDGSVSDYPRLPPAGLESRTLEAFVRVSRGDFDQLPDNDIDDFSARIFYRPCWLLVP